MYENNFQSLAIFRGGPFSVNLCQLYSCTVETSEGWSIYDSLILELDKPIHNTHDANHLDNTFLCLRK